MHQFTQKLRAGEINILEVPAPNYSSSQVLVQNYYSLISAGTESSTVNAARKSLLGKAKERPQQVKRGHRHIKNPRAIADLPGRDEEARCLFTTWLLLWAEYSLSATKSPVSGPVT